MVTPEDEIKVIGALRLEIPIFNAFLNDADEASRSLVDHQGEVRAGQYVWRPAGSRHTARAPQGALVLGFFLKPNRFFA